MKCINKRKKQQIFLSCMLSFALALSVTACGKSEVTLPFSEFADREAFSYAVAEEEAPIKGMAENLCVSATNVAIEGIDTQMLNGAGLFDMKREEVRYGDRMFEHAFPASMTKVLTAYIVLKDVQNGAVSMDTPVPISANTVIHETGVAACAFLEGDQVTVEQALNVMIIRSDNGAAVALAELISGSTEAFAERMNQEAAALGATNSHFMNPHGLNHAEHYSTVYDLYLIFAKALEFDTFANILQKKEYETVVTDANGAPRTISCTATNYFASGKAPVPEGVLFLGGKTGTTKAAGNCLIIYTLNAAGDPFISLVMGAQDRDTVYIKLTELLEQTLKY